MNGVHYNERQARRMENRICAICGFTFTAARGMTAEELSTRGMA